MEKKGFSMATGLTLTYTPSRLQFEAPSVQSVAARTTAVKVKDEANVEFEIALLS